MILLLMVSLVHRWYDRGRTESGRVRSCRDTSWVYSILEISEHIDSENMTGIMLRLPSFARVGGWTDNNTREEVCFNA